jgi:hypothetical protein
MHFGPPFFRWIAPNFAEPLRTAWTENPPHDVFELFGVYHTVAKSVTVLVTIWAVALWMQRRKLFLKV